MKQKMKTSSKKTLVHFLFVMSILLVLGSTYAWVTGKDERVNKFDSPNAKIKISIEGNTNPLLISPGLDITRDIRIKNNSEQSIFVRVSLTEVMANLKIDTVDQTGNAHIKNFNGVTPKPTATVKEKDVSTWVVSDYYQADSTHLYQIDKVLTYLYQEPQTGRHVDLSKVTIGTPNVSTTFNSGSTNYWLYYDNYFYYSEPLLPDKESAILIKNISVPTDFPNRLKGSLYEHDIDAEGVLRNDTVYGAWGIPKTPANPVYNMLHNRLNQ